ncbi:DUF305 domain-containing protein [Nocardioides sp. ChNu-153]|uniref:DUF305 domain-containing protein n=1 Tax=unclassified Nocardioides TaxID=2615069 RepID=UPI0024054DC0|nr:MULTISPECIES: DUF305 domain-containing protein [unclassified Nocardioides]MDF9718057.1 DUF305 domain-containing protein [Nocardioides sp. ChNu-99]MDN7121201.1 DUF305 domain-containing protein [Nocardioides sp. ChNu-153]
MRITLNLHAFKPASSRGAKRRATAALALAATLSLGLAACGNGDSDSSGGHGGHSNSDSSGSAESGADFNDSDVTFAQQMIPHHEQATEMAALAEGRTQNAEVLALAQQIADAQGPEIETMQGFLEDWGAEEVDHEGMDHEGMPGMDGMMSEEDMASLEDSSGSEFDEAFLTMMIEHHEGAIEMAETEQEDGENPEAVALAGQIVEDQTAEIATMQELLNS